MFQSCRVIILTCDGAKWFNGVQPAAETTQGLRNPGHCHLAGRSEIDSGYLFSYYRTTVLQHQDRTRRTVRTQVANQLQPPGDQSGLQGGMRYEKVPFGRLQSVYNQEKYQNFFYIPQTRIDQMAIVQILMMSLGNYYMVLYGTHYRHKPHIIFGSRLCCNWFNAECPMKRYLCCHHVLLLLLFLLLSKNVGGKFKI